MKTTQNYFRLALLSSVLFLSACGSNQNDDEIQKDVTKILSSNAYGSQVYGDITASVKGGVVTLDGQCGGDNCSDSAIARIEKSDGVKNIVNNIEETAAPTDLTLRTSVQTIISKYPGVQADVAAGVIVLRGTLKRDQLQPLMNELSSLKAKKIDNQLAIQQL